MNRELSPAEREAVDRAIVNATPKTYEFAAAFLAELEKGQEPVAYICEGTDKFGLYYSFSRVPSILEHERVTPLYLRPTIPADMVMVPRVPNIWWAMKVANLARVWPDDQSVPSAICEAVLNYHRAMISAAEGKK